MYRYSKNRQNETSEGEEEREGDEGRRKKGMEMKEGGREGGRLRKEEEKGSRCYLIQCD